MIINDKGLDALIISDFYNMRYITGYSGDAGYAYISGKRNVIITDSRYTVRAKEEASGFDVAEISADRGYKATLSDLIKGDGAVNIGFEDKSISYADYKLFCGLNKDEEDKKSGSAGGVCLVELGESLNDLRQIKTLEEIEKIANAEHIGDLAFKKIMDFIKPGMTELSVAAMLELYMKDEGAEALSFDTIVASGINSSKPHAVPGRKEIEVGDFVTMDFGCKYEGYCSDMTRTIVMGRASDKQRDVYNTVLEAQQIALDMIKEGVACVDVDKTARDYIDNKGYAGCFGHGLGHSVGLFIHESPAFNTKSKALLKKNMLETVEPGIYIEGFGGVRIEDLVVVTEEGYRNLTGSPKELIIL